MLGGQISGRQKLQKNNCGVSQNINDSLNLTSNLIGHEQWIFRSLCLNNEKKIVHENGLDCLQIGVTQSRLQDLSTKCLNALITRPSRREQTKAIKVTDGACFHFQCHIPSHHIHLEEGSYNWSPLFLRTATGNTARRCGRRSTPTTVLLSSDCTLRSPPPAVTNKALFFYFTKDSLFH